MFVATSVLFLFPLTFVDEVAEFVSLFITQRLNDDSVGTNLCAVH